MYISFSEWVFVSLDAGTAMLFGLAIGLLALGKAWQMANSKKIKVK